MNATTVSSVGFAPKHLSGIDVIDNAWGGLYRGGSYLIYGRAASGRGLLTLMFTRTGAALKEPTLFISSDRQKDLMIQAASLGFNLREAYENGIVRLMRVPPLMNLQEMGDDAVAKALLDLVGLIRQHRPIRLVMNDFMPFVAFRSFDRFRVEFVQFLEQIDSLETTMALVMPEPANQQSRRVIDFMSMQMTGSIHIELADDNLSTTKRRITLIPHIGHIKRQVVDYWDLEDVVIETTEAEQAAIGPMTQSEMPTFQAGAMPTATGVPPTPIQPGATTTSQSPQVPVAAPPPGLASTPPVQPQYSAPAPPVAGDVQTPAEVPPQAVTPVPEPPKAPLAESDSTGQAADRDYTDRESFRLRLQQQFLMRESGLEPFLLLAMRMDRGDDKSSRPFDFDFLMDLVRATLRAEDDMLVEVSDERLVVFLSKSRPEEAQSFFARLKERLRQESPQQADHLLHSVSAIVVPDGRPFKSAEEFLNYALVEA